MLWIIFYTRMRRCVPANLLSWLQIRSLNFTFLTNQKVVKYLAKNTSVATKLVCVTPAAAPVVALIKPTPVKETDGFQMITMTVKFNCRYTKIRKKLGGEFILYGYINGINQELQEAKLTGDKWRFSTYVSSGLIWMFHCFLQSVGYI